MPHGFEITNVISLKAVHKSKVLPIRMAFFLFTKQAVPVKHYKNVR